MLLLDAVNTVLPYLGEHKITNVIESKHPTVNLIVDAIERQNKGACAEGWYFNTYNTKIPVNTSGRIDVPKDILAVYGLNKAVSIDGEFFFDLDNNTRYFTETLEVRLIKYIDFEKLPYYMAQYVMYRACHEMYIQDNGTDSTSQIILQLSSEARNMLRQENLRTRGYNSRHNLIRQNYYATRGFRFR